MDFPSGRSTSDILAKRTRQITVVLEDLYQPHNASSILKTCDAFGIQDLHVVQQKNRFQFDPEKTNGVEHLVDCHLYDGADAAAQCLTALKQEGYQIAATTLRSGCVTIDTLETSGRWAFCFGTEEKGLSQTVHDLADVFIRIPMFGLTQSFNVSVTVALALQIRQQTISPATFEGLTDGEMLALRQKWSCN